VPSVPRIRSVGPSWAAKHNVTAYASSYSCSICQRRCPLAVRMGASHRRCRPMNSHSGSRPASSASGAAKVTVSSSAIVSARRVFCARSVRRHYSSLSWRGVWFLASLAGCLSCRQASSGAAPAPGCLGSRSDTDLRQGDEVFAIATPDIREFSLFGADRRMSVHRWSTDTGSFEMISSVYGRPSILCFSARPALVSSPTSHACLR
jgi:hypothetical protein